MHVENPEDVSICVTEEMVELVADTTIQQVDRKTGESYTVSLRDSSGKAKLQACLFALGFDLNAGYEMLTTIEKCHKDNKPQLKVRSALIPYMTFETKVYAGRLRRNYPHKAIYSKDKMLVADDFNKPYTNILKVGDKDSYSKGCRRDLPKHLLADRGWGEEGRRKNKNKESK